MRVYSARLLGRDKRLVLHGGGNSSLKTMLRDLIGEAAEVLCVKGSGWDMADIEPAGLAGGAARPAAEAAEARCAFRRGHGAGAARQPARPVAPNPSVETLLHAFLPHRYVDHTHATAVLSIADQPDGAERCIELYGRRMGLVPYIMPGFALAKKAAEIFEADPTVEGLVLLKHGIFTFGDTARESYERMIDAVTLAEERLARRRKNVFRRRGLAAEIARGRGGADPARRVRSPRRERGRAPICALSWISAPARRSSTMSTAPSSSAMPTPAWSRPTTRSAPRTIR